MIFLEGDRCISKTHRSEFEAVGGSEEAVVEHAGERYSYEYSARLCLGHDVELFGWP